MKNLALAVCLLLGAPLPSAQTGAWRVVRDDDQLHGKIHDKLMLTGKFLKPPHNTIGALPTPLLVVSCSAGELEHSYMSVGAVLDAIDLRTSPVDAAIDGKQTFIFGQGLSTDGQAVYFDEVGLKKILNGRRVLLGVPQYLGPQIVVEFNMPSPEPVLTACGKDITRSS